MTAVTPVGAPVLTPYCGALHKPGGRCVYCYPEGFSLACHEYERQRISYLAVHVPMYLRELQARLKYLRTI